MAKFETLTDDFGFADTGKWTFSGAAAVVVGQLELPVISTYVNKATSVASYDLTGSAFYVQLVQPPNLGNGSTEAYIDLEIDASNQEIFILSGTTLFMRERVAAVNSDATITFDSVNHKWLRIRESGGTIFWDTSPDGTVWTNQRSKVAGMAVTSLRALLYSGFWGTEPSPGTAIFDNVNVPAAANAGFLFAMF